MTLSAHGGRRVRRRLHSAALPNRLFPPLFNRYESGMDVGSHVDNAIRTHAAILYPASSVHRVQPVTRGARIASFFWIESRVREAEKCRLLFEMDTAILAVRTSQGESVAAVKLTGCYHNLLRMWAT